MAVVDEKGFELLQQYQQLLDTVDEEFTYIKQYESSEIYKVLAEIFSAFLQLGKTQRLLQEYFPDDEPFVTSIQHFSTVIEGVEELEGRFTRENMVQYLIPVFHQWKVSHTEILAKYRVQ